LVECSRVAPGGAKALMPHLPPDAMLPKDVIKGLARRLLMQDYRDACAASVEWHPCGGGEALALENDTDALNCASAA
jgi:hypothetical protein